MKTDSVIIRSKFSLLNKYFIVLYGLNISDLFFTRFLLNADPHLFIEANIFLRPIINSWQIYLVKIVLLALVLLYWYRRSKKSTEKQLRNSIFVSRILVIAYSLINCLHLLNLIILGVVSF